MTQAKNRHNETPIIGSYNDRRIKVFITKKWCQSPNYNWCCNVSNDWPPVLERSLQSGNDTVTLRNDKFTIYGFSYCRGNFVEVATTYDCRNIHHGSLPVYTRMVVK